MKIIEAMKKIKDLQIKEEGLKSLVSKNCALMSFETPVYENQKEQVSEWIQAHTDINKEILKLRILIQKTNILTDVTMQIRDKSVTKSIAMWIHRRRDLAGSDEKMWRCLTDRGLKEQPIQSASDGPVTELKIVRFFNPLERDKMIELYRSEPGIIDRTLEVVNATTDLVE